VPGGAARWRRSRTRLRPNDEVTPEDAAPESRRPTAIQERNSPEKEIAIRLACLTVPLFPLAARLRCEPELRGEAVAVVEGSGPTARLVAASRRARRAGVVPGSTFAQAQALLPGLLGRPRDPEAERAAQETLLELAESFSPRVEDVAPGTVFLDLEGCTGRSPGEQAERELGRALLLAADRAGLPGRLGVAGSKLAAQVATAHSPTPHVVPAGEEAAFLAPLPLARLAPELELADTLQRWGIGSAGELARLPAAEVASRLGDAGRLLHAQARGLDPRPLVARQPPPELREGVSLEWPLVALEPFLFLARGALERLCDRLAAQGLACARLVTSLRLEPDGWREHTVTLPAPTRDVKVLLTLLRLALEAEPPGAPVSGFAFLAHPDRPRAAQRTLFGPQEIPPDRLATTLARLFALLGPGRIGAPAATDGHRPERFALTAYEPPPPPPVRRPAGAGRGLLAVRVLRPPVPLEVRTVEGDAGAGVAAPAQVDERAVAERAPAEGSPGAAGGGERRAEEPRGGEGRGVQGGAGRRVERRRVEEPAGERRHVAGCGPDAAAPSRKPLLAGRVRVASGPWEVEEAWWGDQAVDREYWDVELEAGGVFRIFRDRRQGGWFADGVYD
jgi:protein ImuB